MKELLKNMRAGMIIWVGVFLVGGIIYCLIRIGKLLFVAYPWETAITWASLGFLHLTYLIGKHVRKQLRSKRIEKIDNGNFL